MFVNPTTVIGFSVQDEVTCSHWNQKKVDWNGWNKLKEERQSRVRFEMSRPPDEETEGWFHEIQRGWQEEGQRRVQLTILRHAGERKEPFYYWQAWAWEKSEGSCGSTNKWNRLCVHSTILTELFICRVAVIPACLTNFVVIPSIPHLQ